MKIKSDFFISYRQTVKDEKENSKGKDVFNGQNIANKLLNKPLVEKGYEVHFDPEKKAAGNYSERLEEAIKSCRVFLWVLSSDCLVCKANTDTKNIDWFYAEILWAIKYKKLRIPVISPEFVWPNQKEFNANFNRAFHVLVETGYLDVNDKKALEEAKKMYKCEGHMECIILKSKNEDFKISVLLDLISKAKKSNRKLKKPVRYKKAKFMLAYIVALSLLVFAGYRIKVLYDEYKQPHIWTGEKTIKNGWDSVKGKGTSDDPYQIETPEQLAWLAYTTQASTCEGKYYKLVKDIYLNEYNAATNNNGIGGEDNLIQVENDRYLDDIDNIHEWEPIGNSDYPFSGNFDGDGFTVKGLYLNSDKDNQGLFGVCSEESRIENVNLYCATIKSSGSYIGGIAGRCDGVIDGCNVYSLFINGKSYVGGVVGNGNVVVNCFSNVWVTCERKGEKYCGGIAGICNYLLNSSSSMTCDNINNWELVGELSGTVLHKAYNCVALMKETDAWNSIGTLSDEYNNIYCSDENIDSDISSSDSKSYKYTQIKFDQNVSDILNHNIKELDDKEILYVLNEYGQNSKSIELNSWISWKNPKRVWYDMDYVPFLEPTYDSYNEEEWFR